MPSTFDIIVIGAGPAGYVAAIRGAQLGLKVAIVEREALGGICLNWGCIPTKTLLRSAELLTWMRRAEEFGLSAGPIGYDLAAMIDRSRRVAGRLSTGVAHLMKKNGIAVVMGEARLLAKGQLAVKTKLGVEELSAPAVVIATGARGRRLPGLEPDGDLIWGYRDALVAKRTPRKLLVVGAGAIGIEFASFFHTLGAETTVVEALDRILPAEDAEISAFAKKQFVKLGMQIRENTMVKPLSRASGRIAVELHADGRFETAEFDTLVSAAGVVGNWENLGLETLGVKIERDHVMTDSYCRTGVEGLFAIGDVGGGPWLAHKASHEGVMVAELIAGRRPRPVKPDNIPCCTYCQPQIASIGLTEEKALAAGYQIKVGRFRFVGNGKAIALGEPEGLVKTVFDARTDALLGAHMVGAEVTELIQGFSVGRTLETTSEELMETVFPHPTLSEAMHESVLDAYRSALHA